MVEFGRKHIPNYNHTDGFGYHEFINDQYISSYKKILMMDKVSIFIIINYSSVDLLMIIRMVTCSLALAYIVLFMLDLM